MDGNELFYSNLESFQPAGWKMSKDRTMDTEHYQGVTKISVTLETALLLSIAVLGAIMLLAINLVGPVFCKRCFRRSSRDPEQGEVFHLSPVHVSENFQDRSGNCSESDNEDPALIMENKHAVLETVTYMQDCDEGNDT